MGALASALILLGIGILYAVVGSTNFYVLSSLISSTNYTIPFTDIQGFAEAEGKELSSSGSIIGLLFILIGLIWKFAGAPLHNWAVDVYDAIPTVSASWLAIIPKIALITIASEIILLISSSNIILNDVNKLIIFVSTLSMVIGAIGALTQPLIKRLLTYSSIGQLGFILLGLGIGAQDYAFFYLTQYTVTNTGIWLCLLVSPVLNPLPFNTFTREASEESLKNAGSIVETEHIIPNIKIDGEIRSINELQGLHDNNIFISIAFALLLLSTAGVPPMVGFFSKYYIISASINTGFWGLSIIAIVSSLISAVYYLRVIKTIWFSSYSSSLFDPLHYSLTLKPITSTIGFIPGKNLISSIIDPFINLTYNPLTYLTNLTKDMERGKNRNYIKLESASSITYSTALIISIITLVVSLFIAQGAVILTWCTLIFTI